MSRGDRTVIPVARISYGFRGGGAPHSEQASPSISKGAGGGGGGRMSAMPAGALEITSTGTGFVAFYHWEKLVSVPAVSFALGFVLANRRPHS